jgi:hypothetical protein
VKHASTKQSLSANRNSRLHVSIGAGLAIGAGLGVALGAAIDNLPLGLAIGTGFGLSIGAVIGNSPNQQGKASAAEAVREKQAFALIIIGSILLFATVATVLLVY